MTSGPVILLGISLELSITISYLKGSCGWDSHSPGFSSKSFPLIYLSTKIFTKFVIALLGGSCLNG